MGSDSARVNTKIAEKPDIDWIPCLLHLWNLCSGKASNDAFSVCSSCSKTYSEARKELLYLHCSLLHCVWCLLLPVRSSNVLHSRQVNETGREPNSGFIS